MILYNTYNKDSNNIASSASDKAQKGRNSIVDTYHWQNNKLNNTTTTTIIIIIIIKYNNNIITNWCYDNSLSHIELPLPSIFIITYHHYHHRGGSRVVNEYYIYSLSNSYPAKMVNHDKEQQPLQLVVDCKWQTLILQPSVFPDWHQNE